MQRLFSRKFLVAVLAALGALGVALQDGMVTQPELWSILAPLLTWSGIEGAVDYSRNK